MNDCLVEHCDDVPDFQTCASNNCWDEINQCYLYDADGSACEGNYRCRSGCGQGDQGCMDRCDERMSDECNECLQSGNLRCIQAICPAEIDALGRCAQENACEDDPCIEEHCSDEWEAIDPCIAENQERISEVCEGFWDNCYAP